MNSSFEKSSIINHVATLISTLDISHIFYEHDHQHHCFIILIITWWIIVKKMMMEIQTWYLVSFILKHFGEETIFEIDKREKGWNFRKMKNEKKFEIWMSSWAHWLYTPWLWATTILLCMGSRWPKMVGHRILIGQEISLSLSTTSFYQLKRSIV
jgi:hypothetical protein